MKKLNAEQIQDNYQQIMNIIDRVFTDERKDGLNRMFTELGEKFMFAPASSIKYFHNAFPGGLCEHTLNVIRVSNKLYDLWKLEGAAISDFELSNLIFCALVHDIGKVGNHDQDFYVTNDSEWHQKNRGMIYKLNPEIVNMRHEERTIWLLNYYGIKISENEYISIIVHSGPGTESNKFYYDNFTEEKHLKSELPYILHTADFIAWRIEYNDYKKNKTKYEMASSIEKENEKVGLNKIDANAMFNKLFPDKDKK